MNELTCSVGDCDKPVRVVKRMMCSTHYVTWARKNKPNGQKPCSVEGCQKTHFAKSFCNNHYQRYLQTGAPQPADKVQKFCTEHPDRPVRAADKCVRCYSNWYYYHGHELGPSSGADRRKDVCLYEAAHGRVRRDKGHPTQYTCVRCPAQATEWALLAEASQILVQPEGKRMAGSLYSPNPDDYVPMCRKCHSAYDAAEGPKKEKAAYGQGPRYEEHKRYMERNRLGKPLDTSGTQDVQTAMERQFNMGSRTGQ